MHLNEKVIHQQAYRWKYVFAHVKKSQGIDVGFQEQ